MSSSCPTIENLIALGFERRRTRGGLAGVGYRFVNLDLDAVDVHNLYARYVVLLTGLIDTGRRLAIIEHQIPPDLGSSLEVAAWISYVLRSNRSDLEPLPDWFVEGERHWHLVAPARDEIAARERQRAYAASPKCQIDRDYARPLRRNLQEELSWLDDEAEMTFRFDGRVLSVDFRDRTHEVVASGDGWPCAYQVVVSPEMPWPARFMSWMVELCMFDGYVHFNGERWWPYEEVL